MSPVRSSGLRHRAVALLVVCVALAAGTTFAKGNHRVPLDGAPDQAAADVLHVARNQLGDPYEWGGNGPDRWDCSGLTSLWRTVGGAKGMPRVSRDQQTWTIPVAPRDALRGDLVFFGHPVTHVGIVSGGGYMIDAGASRSAVVQRLIWKTGVVRYGRVPRPGMPKVKPWTPPPLPSPQPAAPVADSPEAAAAPRPAAKPASKPVAKPKPAAKPAAQPASKPVAKPKPAAKPAAAVPPPLKGLPAKQKHVSSMTAYKAAAIAKGFAGAKAGPGGWSDVALVHVAWRKAGGGNLPGDRGKLAARGKPVRLSDARIGDLVVYGRPAVPHVGIYLGGGKMVDASPKQGRVVIRPVYAASSVKLVRLG